MDSFGSGSVGEANRMHTTAGRLFLAALLMLLFTGRIASADSFADNLANFLLGSEAEAAVLDSHGSELDAVTQQCIDCHNGGNASHVIAANTHAPRQVSNFGMLGNHPVGMNYYSYASSKPGEYTRQSSLNPNIVLVDGNVSCISCHKLKDVDPSTISVAKASMDNTHSQTDSDDCAASGNYTMGPSQTDLCLACHNM